MRPGIGLAVRQIGVAAIDAQVGRNDIAVAGVVQLQHKAAVTGDDAGFHRALYRLIHSKAGVALGYGSSAGIGSAGQLIRISLHIRAVQLLLIVLHLVGGIGIGRPRGVQVRPAGHGLAGHILILTLAAPVLEGVTLAGGSGSVCGGQSRTPAHGGGVQQAIVLAVILLVSSQILSGLEVDNLIKVIDHALQVRPAVDGDPLQTGGRIGKVLRVLIPLAVVIPAVEFNVALVIVADLQLGQVDDRAGQLGIQRDISVSLGGIAVAIDHNMDRDAVSGLNDVVHASFLRLADPLAGFLIKGQNPGQGSGTDKLMCLFLGLRARRISLHKGSSIQHDIIRAVHILRQLIAIVAAQYPVGARSVLGAGVDALDRHSHIAQRGLHVIIGGAIRGRLDLSLALALDHGVFVKALSPLSIFPIPSERNHIVGGLICVRSLGFPIKLADVGGSVQSDGVSPSGISRLSKRTLVHDVILRRLGSMLGVRSHALDRQQLSHGGRIVLAGALGLGGIALNENLSGLSISSHKNPIPSIRKPGRVYRHCGSRVYMIHIAGMTGMLAIVKRKIPIQVNGDLALPVAVRQLLLITHTVIAVLQTIAVIVRVGSLANDLDNVLAKVKVLAHFGIIRRNRSLLLPNRIQRGGIIVVIHNDRVAGLLAGRSSILVGVPTQEVIALTSRRLRGNGEGIGLLILRGRLVGLAGRCAVAAVGVIVQRESQQNGCAFEIVVCRVLAVGKQSACTFAALVAAASGPGDVVNLVIVNTFPDILCVGQSESAVVDVVLA